MGRVLAADIGGTNCRLALFEQGRLVDRGRFPTAGPGLAEVALGFLAGRGIDGAGIAVAGPVAEGRARLTNHHWSFDERELGEELDAPAVLLNDFGAAVRGIPALPDRGWRHLAGPAPDRLATVVAVGPGTGLGQASLVRAAGTWTILPGEAGHADLAPGCLHDLTTWRSLHARHGHVSWERVLSGPGLLALHEARRAAGLAGDPATHPADVTSGTDPAARAAVGDFLRLLGAFAGNAALTFVPRGGVWLCGGIVPRLADRLGTVVEAFVDKGRLRHVVEGVPLAVVHDDDLGLHGAAAAARDLASAVS